jgi:glycogen(starch) synthase
MFREEEETDEVFQFPLTLKPKKGTGSGAVTPTLAAGANGTE